MAAASYFLGGGVEPGSGEDAGGFGTSADVSAFAPARELNIIASNSAESLHALSNKTGILSSVAAPPTCAGLIRINSGLFTDLCITD
jgi:hypothetical protein